MARTRANSERMIGLNMKTNGATMKAYGTTMKAKTVSFEALKAVIEHHNRNGANQFTAEMLQHAIALDEQWRAGLGKPKPTERLEKGNPA